MIVLKKSPGPDGRFPIPAQDARHLIRVLRVGTGDEFDLVLPSGRRARAILESDRGTPSARLLRELNVCPPPLKLWLGVALIRWPRMEWLVEKATELGVARLTPLLPVRSRQKINDKKTIKINRLEKISNEALKQVGRPFPLEIAAVSDLKDFLNSVSEQRPGARKLLLNPSVTGPRLQESGLDPETWTVLAIGPEGDFTAEEIRQFEDAGFQSVSLGPGILRSETAALYGACFFSSLEKS
jgi:RNA methyltransferase, RsmE family